MTFSSCWRQWASPSLSRTSKRNRYCYWVGRKTRSSLRSNTEKWADKINSKFCLQLLQICFAAGMNIFNTKCSNASISHFRVAFSSPPWCVKTTSRFLRMRCHIVSALLSFIHPSGHFFPVLHHNQGAACCVFFPFSVTITFPLSWFPYISSWDIVLLGVNTKKPFWSSDEASKSKGVEYHSWGNTQHFKQRQFSPVAISRIWCSNMVHLSFHLYYSLCIHRFYVLQVSSITSSMEPSCFVILNECGILLFSPRQLGHS